MHFDTAIRCPMGITSYFFTCWSYTNHTVSHGDHNICFRKLENMWRNLIFLQKSWFFEMKTWFFVMKTWFFEMKLNSLKCNLDSLKWKLDSLKQNSILWNWRLKWHVIMTSQIGVHVHPHYEGLRRTMEGHLPKPSSPPDSKVFISEN